MAQEVDWQKMFGFGDPFGSKVGVVIPTSLGAIAPIYQLNKIQPSTSTGLIVANITVPYTGFTGALHFMSNSSAVIVMSSSGIGTAGNINVGSSLSPNRITSYFCDGTNWTVVGIPTS